MHFISFPFRLSIKGAGLLDWCFQSWQPAAAGEAILEKLKALEEKKIQLMKRLQQEQIDDLTSRLSHTEGREAVQAEQIEELQDAGFSPSETIALAANSIGSKVMISGQAGVVYVMENPVISRALQDIMGMDQGVPVYGETGHLNYVFAVQNGGAPMIGVYI